MYAFPLACRSFCLVVDEVVRQAPEGSSFILDLVLLQWSGGVVAQQVLGQVAVGQARRMDCKDKKSAID